MAEDSACNQDAKSSYCCHRLLDRSYEWSVLRVLSIKS